MLSDRTGWKASVPKMKELERARRRHRTSRDWIGHIDQVVDGVIKGGVKHARSDVPLFDFPTVAGRVNDSGAGWVVPHHNVASLYNRLVEISFDTTEQQRVDQAILRWQRGPGVGRSTKLMAAAYRQVYRQALGQPGHRPTIAVVCPSSPGLTRANASTEIRIWERTVNGIDRDCVFVRMAADTLLANAGAGTLDCAIIQRDAIPATMVAPLLAEMDRCGLRYILDLDDDLFNVPEDKDTTGRYGAYRTSLDAMVRGAATVTTSTEALRQKLLARNSNTVLMPNRLSERLWRGALPPRAVDGVVRALYMGSFTHQSDFEMIAPALAAVAEADPGFRVAVIGVQEGPLPPWAERIAVPEREKSYANFVPWLKDLSGSFDFALAPLTDDPFNLAKSCLKALECGALGLPVLASDMPVYRPLAGQLQGLRLVKSNELAWRKALAAQIAEVRAGTVDRAAIRASVMREHGLAGELAAFDQMLLDLKRPQETDVIVTLQRPQTPSVQKAVA